MKVTELRVGNSIFNSRENKVQIVNLFILDRITKRNDDYKPIPLSEEWLFNHGAERFGNGDLSLNGHLISWMECRKVFVHRATSVELLFIHTWQNLYFALTAEELIKK